MAVLRASYNLCPLVGYGSLIGITEDHDPDTVLVTLGGKMAVKYRVSDRNQTRSWTTKHKFTSPMVFDSENNRYLAVVNDSQLCILDKDVLDIDQSKRYGFAMEIHSVHAASPVTGDPYLVFKNGYISPLSKAIETRKEEKRSVLGTGSVLQQCHIMSSKEYRYAVYLTIMNEKYTPATGEIEALGIHVYHLTGDLVITDGRNVSMSREGKKIVGKTLLEKKETCSVITLWSDGRLYSLNILPEPDNKLPGTLIHHFQDLNVNSAVSMVALDANHIAIYGAEPSEEGAVLLIFNLQYLCVQSRQNMKLYTKPPLMWHLHSNLYLPIGQNLTIVSYFLQETCLANMIGVHRQKGTDIIEVKQPTLMNWGSKDEENIDIDLPQPQQTFLKKQSSVASLIKTLETVGQPDSMICEEIFPQLIQEKDYKSLHDCCKYFKDIPESVVVDLLQLCLQFSEKELQVLRLSCEDESVPAKLFESDRMKLLNQLWFMPVNEVSILGHMHRLHFEEIMNFLQYLCFILPWSSVSGHEHDFPPSLFHVVCWANLLLSSHYNQLVLKSSEEVMKLVKCLEKFADEECTFFEELQSLQSILVLIKEKKTLPVRKPKKPYSIEVLTFF